MSALLLDRVDDMDPHFIFNPPLACYPYPVEHSEAAVRRQQQHPAHPYLLVSEKRAREITWQMSGRGVDGRGKNDSSLSCVKYSLSSRPDREKTSSSKGRCEHLLINFLFHSLSAFLSNVSSLLSLMPHLACPVLFKPQISPRLTPFPAVLFFSTSFASTWSATYLVAATSQQKDVEHKHNVVADS